MEILTFYCKMIATVFHCKEICFLSFFLLLLYLIYILSVSNFMTAQCILCILFETQRNRHYILARLCLLCKRQVKFLCLSRCHLRSQACLFHADTVLFYHNTAHILRYIREERTVGNRYT